MRSLRRVFSVLAILAALAASIPTAWAQLPPLSGREVPEHSLALRFGWDSTWTVGVAYTMSKENVFFQHDGSFDAALDIPIAFLGRLSDWKFSIGSTTRFTIDGDWAVAWVSHTTLIRSTSAAGRTFTIGSTTMLRTGAYGSDGAAVFDLSMRVADMTNIAHSDLVRATFDERPIGAVPGPRGKWCRNTSQRIGFGLAAALESDRDAFSLGFGGVEHSAESGLEAGPMLGQLPFHFVAGWERKVQ